VGEEQAAGSVNNHTFCTMPTVSAFVPGLPPPLAPDAFLQYFVDKGNRLRSGTFTTPGYLISLVFSNPEGREEPSVTTEADIGVVAAFAISLIAQHLSAAMIRSPNNNAVLALHVVSDAMIAAMRAHGEAALAEMNEAETT
jgi:hypothetical protein